MESTPQEGSTFTVVLDLEIDGADVHPEIEQKPLDKELLEQISQGTYHILIVEDNKTNQIIAQSILKPIG